MAALVMLLALCAALPSTSRAEVADAHVRVRVSVRDVDDKKPVPNALVYVIGPAVESGATDGNGLKSFGDLPQGTYYVRVTANGFLSAKSAEFDVDETGVAQVTVSLGRDLKTIGHVSSRSRADVNAIDQDSVERKASSDALSALSKLAGVGVDESNGNLTFTLNNQTVSPDGVTINGQHIGGQGSQAVASVFRGLFTGASVSFLPTAYSPAGGIDFRTIQPTSTFRASATIADGSFNQYTGSIAVSGPAGRLSYAFQHVQSGADNYLSGQYYLDESGEYSYHDGGATNGASLAKLRYALSPTTSANVTFLDGSRDSTILCNVDVTLVPCGPGTGSSRSVSARSTDASLTTLAHGIAVIFDAAHTTTDTKQNQIDRFIDGVASPFFSDYAYSSDSVSVNLSTSSPKSTTGLMLSSSDDRLLYHQYFQFPDALVQSDQNQLMQLTESYKLNSRVSISPAVSIKRNSISGFADGASLSVSRQASSNTSLSLDVSDSSEAPPLTLARLPLSDPASAQYDCVDGYTTVVGGSDAATKSSDSSVSGTIRQVVGTSTFTGSAYYKVERGGSLFATLPLDAESQSSIFPDGYSAYISGLEETWSSPLVCGNQPFDANRVYVQQLTYGSNFASRGVNVSGRIPVNQRVMIVSSVALNSSVATSLDQRFSNPGSFYHPWAQLPSLPTVKANLSIDALQDRSNVEGVVNVQFASKNNAQNQPANLLENVALIKKNGRSTITLRASNILNVDSGLFATARGVDPYLTRAGSLFALPSYPLAPRTITLTFDFAVRAADAAKR